MEFQKAKKNDSGIVFNIIKLCADDMAKNGLFHWIPYYPEEKIIEDIINKDVFIVKNEEDTVATFTLTIDKEKSEAYLGKVAVIPQKSSKGIGTQCMQFIDKHLKTIGINKIVIDVYDKSLKAINFYKKNDFKIIGKKKTRRFEVYIMEKELI